MDGVCVWRAKLSTFSEPWKNYTLMKSKDSRKNICDNSFMTFLQPTRNLFWQSLITIFLA